MAIEVKCKCGSEYRLDDSRAGELFSCRVCGASMTLPTGVGRATPTAEPAAQPKKVAAAASPKAPAPAVRPTPAGGEGPDEFGESLNVPPAAPTKSAAPAAPTTLRPQPQAQAAAPGNAATPSVPEPPAVPMAGRHTRPPLSWWLARTILWGICAGALFLPWYAFSGTPSGGEPIHESMTGFEFVTAVCNGIGDVAANVDADDLPSPTRFLNAPEGTGRVLAGAAMMAFGPCVYALGLLAVIVIVPIAANKNGAGSMWPFLMCLVGLGGFVVGWHLLAGSDLLAPGLDIAAQVGVTIGVTGWAYTMAVLLIPITLIARAKPDYRLIQAVQWSKQQSSTGPF